MAHLAGFDGEAPRRGPGLAPVATSTRREGVIAEIKRGIVLGTIVPGQRLTETQLSETLGVSRPTVREALNQVAREGLLVQEPYRGLRVAGLEPGALLDIAAVRMALDMQAADAILDDGTGRRLAAVESAWRAYESSSRSDDPLVQHEAHLDFHRGFWQAAENSFLMKLWPVVEAHLTIVLAHDQVTRHDAERAREVHRTIVTALHSGDREQVRAALRAHTVRSAEELVELLGRPG